MDAVLATLFTVGSDIILMIEYYRNYFAMRKAASIEHQS